MPYRFCVPGPSAGMKPIARWNATEVRLPGQVIAVTRRTPRARDVLEEPLVERPAEPGAADGSGSSPTMWM